MVISVGRANWQRIHIAEIGCVMTLIVGAVQLLRMAAIELLVLVPVLGYGAQAIIGFSFVFLFGLMLDCYYTVKARRSLPVQRGSDRDGNASWQFGPRLRNRKGKAKTVPTRQEKVMSLYDRYIQDRESLLEQMEKEKALGGRIGVVYGYLERLSDLRGEYVSGLTRPQAKIALSILGVYKEQFRKLAEHVDCAARPIPELSESAHSSGPPIEKPHRVPDHNALAGIGASTLVAAFLTNPLVAIPAGSLAGVVAAAALLGARRSSSQPVQDESPVVAEGSDSCQSDPDVILSNIDQLFRTVDDVLEEHGRLTEAARTQPLIPRLEDHIRILEFIQDLLGWYQRQKEELPGPLMKALELRLGEQLPDLFSEHGLEISYFRPESKGRDMRLFDFEDEVGKQRLTEPLMVRPALLKGDEVLLRGRVIEPRSAANTAVDHQ